jgi:hypothetical protein
MMLEREGKLSKPLELDILNVIGIFALQYLQKAGVRGV